jgi:lysophospholipase
MNLSYAGTHLSSGRSINGSSCVTGLDQAGFIMGTSASLFNVSIISIYLFKNSYYVAF